MDRKRSATYYHTRVMSNLVRLDVLLPNLSASSGCDNMQCILIRNCNLCPTELSPYDTRCINPTILAGSVLCGRHVRADTCRDPLFPEERTYIAGAIRQRREGFGTARACSAGCTRCRACALRRPFPTLAQGGSSAVFALSGSMHGGRDDRTTHSQLRNRRGN